MSYCDDFDYEIKPREVIISIGFIAFQMGAAIGADVFLDIVMADFTEVCVRINLGTTMRTGRLADGLSTLCTEHCLGFVDGSAKGTRLACRCTLLWLLHRLSGSIGLLEPLGLYGIIRHLLGPYGALQIA